MEKFGKGVQDTGENLIRRMRIAYWITEAKDAQSEYEIIFAFLRK
jgi:hypothetical protein